MTHQDDITADLLDWLGNIVGGLATAFGRPGAGIGAKAVAHAAAEMLRTRQVTTDELVAHIKKVPPLNMPWSKP